MHYEYILNLEFKIQRNMTKVFSSHSDKISKIFIFYVHPQIKKMSFCLLSILKQALIISRNVFQRYVLILIVLQQISICIYIVLHLKQQPTITESFGKCDRFQEKEFSRDFYRYSCKNRLRLGGLPEFIAKVPDKLFRIDGL